MSLLNDMLRDLSQRKTVTDGAEGYDDELLHSSGFTQKKQQPWFWLAGIFVVVFIVVLSINYVMHRFSANANGKMIVPENIQATSTTSAISVISTPVNSTSVSPVVIHNTDVTPSSEQTEKPIENATKIELQNHINDLLQQADRAMGMDRLTAPVEDNAYSYYQKILGMNADNNDAKEGLDKIASRYLMKAQEQAQLGNLQNAETLVQRARFVSARFVQAHEITFDEAGNQATSELNVQSIPEAQAISKPVDAKTETIKPFVVAETPSVSVLPNAGWKDEQLARHAQELIQKGKQLEAQALLKDFIATEQKPALSAALLADTYIQQGNTSAAEIIIEQTTYLPADVKAKLKAQIFSTHGDDVQAIAVLEKNLNAADTNEGYRSLLASLYHKTANYQQSIISYQRLMSSFGEKPAYWLGLALAYDALTQHKSALQAYQRLREYPQLQEQVKQYTEQRIAALRSE